MEETWGRRSEIVRLDEATITEMIKPALAGKKLATAEILSSGHANTNYKLRFVDTDEMFVLKLYTRDYMACQKDISIFEALKNLVPLAQLVYAEPSSDYFSFPYSLVQWVDGRLLDDELAGQDGVKVAEFAYDIGATLAVIGSYRLAGPGLLDQNLEIVLPFTSVSQSWYSFLQNCLFEGHAGRQLGNDLTEQLWQFVKQNVAHLNALPVENALIHADFKGANILVGQKAAKWQVRAVLDWEFAYAGTPLSDVGTLLRHSARFNPAFEPNFVKGFVEQGGKLPDNWRLISRSLDLLNLCDLLNRPQLDETMKAEVRQLVVSTING